MKRLSATAWLTLAYALFIVYGSWVPLAYQPLPFDEAWERFQHIPFLTLGLESRADWVANGVLYLPLTFGISRAWLSRSGPILLVTLASIAGGCALAVGVEFSQLWFPNRTVSLNDVVAECIGSVLGALAAPMAARWLDRLAPALRSGGLRMLPHLLEAYVAAFLLLGYFPYDLLLSADEIRDKWQSDAWGWWLAASDNGRFLTAMQWLVEVALAAPLGMMGSIWGRQHGGSTAPSRALLRAAGLGLALGLVIEVGQFFVATGTSQGASVLSRVAGVVAGAALLPGLRRVGGPGWRALLRPWVWVMWLVYLPALAAASGLFRHAWHGSDAAGATWQATHLLPFYYHYYTTEALAMYSLGSVVLLYAPVAGLAALAGWRGRWTAAVTAGLAVLVEVAKLFVDDLHPDPTNVLVAVVGNALWQTLLVHAQRQAPAEVRNPSDECRATEAQGHALWWLVLPSVLAWAAFFPTAPGGLVALLLAAAAATARWPVVALGLVPAAMPLLDLAPWSGRYFLDEFDLLQATVLAVAFARLPATVTPPARSGWWRLVVAAVALGLGASTLRGLWPFAALDANAFASLSSPYNALRIAKGAAWAWAFLQLWQRLKPTGALRARVFIGSLLVGLAGTLAVIVWERMTFASLWDFAAELRVVGPFSAMHRGGAYVECYLAVGAAFALAVLLGGRAWQPRLAAVLLVLGCGYAMMVTFSRNGYAALAVVTLASLAVAIRTGFRDSAGWRPWVLGGLVALTLTAVSWPVLTGSYAQQRLSQSVQDLEVRRAHWADGLALRDDSLLTSWIGMGLGRFPEAHYWHSAEVVHAASFRIVPAGKGNALRLAQGARLYVEQIVPRPDTGALTLEFDVKGAAGPRGLEWSLCEKWSLNSLGCATLKATDAKANSDGWQHVQAALDASKLLARPAPWRASWRLSLFTPDQGVIEVTRLRLKSAAGAALLVNGDFGHGMDHWFFTTDIDPPWHLHSLPVAVLFDQGWWGVASMLALSLTVGGVGTRLLWRGRAQVPAALPALLGFATSGLLNTLIDAPRFLWLLFVLMGLAVARQPASSRNTPPSSDEAR